MEELKEKIKKMEDIKSLVANQEGLKEKMKNNNTLPRNDLVLVLERRLDDKIDIVNKKQKDVDEKMSTIMQNINTLTQNMSTMTQNHNTLIEMLQRLTPILGQVNGPHMLDASFHVGNTRKESRRIAKRNKD